MAARATEELKPPVFVKSDRPVRVYWADEGQTRKTNNKHNAGSTVDNVPKSKDWEHKLEVREYPKKYNLSKKGTKTWEEKKGKCYYLILQHCPPELKTELKNLARWEPAAASTNVVALLLITSNVMHN